MNLDVFLLAAAPKGDVVTPRWTETRKEGATISGVVCNGGLVDTHPLAGVEVRDYGA